MKEMRNLPGAAWSFNESEILDAKKNNHLLNCDIEITKLCNLKCQFCYSDSGKPVPDELELSEIFEIIIQAKNLNAKTITLTGGEPLAHKSFFDIAKFIVDNGMRCLFFSNGNYITPEIAQKLFNLNALPCISLESMTSSIHDEMVGVPGAFEKTISGIENLIGVGYTKELPLTVNSVITQKNISGLLDVWNWAIGKNIEPFLLRLITAGRVNSNSGLQITPLMLKELVEQISSISDFQPDIPYFGNSGCNKHAISCFITAQGFVQPCSGLTVSSGNIRNKNLSEILSNSPIIDLMRNIEHNIQGECKECEHKKKCYGCRGLTYGTTGDMVGPDPLCWHHLSAEQN